jgi:hypothetical protein
MMDILADNQLRDWLLHRLDPEQAAMVEEHVMSDDVIVDRLLELRADLFDDYARGNLDAETRRVLQARSLTSPADRDRMALALALAKSRSAKSRSRGRVWAFGALAAGVMLAAGLTLLRYDDTPIQTSASTRNVLPTIALRASVHRGAAAVDVDLPAGDALRLQMEIERPDPNARYALHIMDGDVQVFQAHALSLLRAGPIDFIEATLPTPVMGPGTRRIVVTDEKSAANVQTWTLTTHKAN